ncbi:MAG: phenylalanine--tRNA ligase subunit alpha [Pseudomonadota bacterium]
MDDLKAKYLSRIADAADEATLEEIRVATVGKKGEVALQMRELGRMTPEERQVAGPALNALKDEINGALAARKAALADAALEERMQSEWLDVTKPARPRRAGTVHPISQVIEEVTAIFAEMGFGVAEGPHVDTDVNNFVALNIPDHHPARVGMDPFRLHRAEGDDQPPRVLRTHTSPAQIRNMATTGAPVRTICPGAVYRAATGQTHTPMFHQVEGLAVDKGISMAHLKWVLEEFAKSFFEDDGIELRFRASHVPFTEPSMQVDIGCSTDNGSPRVGAGDDWLDILGGGMVHPVVLEACDLDPAEWQGFAFWMRVDRIAMLKYGIADPGACFDSDLRWLRHYGFAALDVPTLHGGLSR